MPSTNIVSAYEPVIFTVRVDDDVFLDLRLEYLCQQGAVLKIIEPVSMHGETFRLPHIPAFAYPGLRGYHYRGRITGKFTEGVCRVARERYKKRCIVVSRRQEIEQYLAVGLTYDEISQWLNGETGLRFLYKELSEMLSDIGGI